MWNWSGPGGFASTIQNPINDTTWGTYQLIVTEKRNGCKDTALKTLSFWDFGTLAGRYLNLSGVYKNQSIQLSWSDNVASNADYYEIEKSSANTGFNKIGTVFNLNSNELSSVNFFSFTDNSPYAGDNYYRIKSISKQGLISYSNIVDINGNPVDSRKIYLINSFGEGRVSLACNTDKDCSGKIVMYNVIGQSLESQTVQLNKGLNIIDIPVFNKQKSEVLVVSLFINNQLAFTQKALF